MTDRARIEEIAALWLMRRDGSDWSEADQAELDDWLTRSPAHKAAFWRLEFGYGRMDRLSVLSCGNPQSNLNFRSGTVPRLLSWSMPVTMRPMLITASIAAAFMIGHFLVEKPRPAQTTRHATRFGQVGTIELADGSQVDLNTNTGVRIGQSSTERSLWLDRGEAYFEVTHDRDRPFVVHAGSNDVTVLGTKFAVLRDGNKVTVSVLDGRVRVNAAPRLGGGSVTITSGGIASTDGDLTRIEANKIDQIRNSLAWREGKVIFDNTALKDAAAQFNRYNERKLAVSGDKAENLRIGGSFRLGNVDGFARLLESAYGLRVKLTEKEIKISGD